MQAEEGLHLRASVTPGVQDNCHDRRHQLSCGEGALQSLQPPMSLTSLGMQEYFLSRPG